MILVTGGLGFIGAHTSRALLDLGERCVIAQRRPGRPPGFLDAGERAVVARMDCTEPRSVQEIGERHEITGVVHLAGIGLTSGDPLDELWANTQALFTMLRAARSWGVRRFVLASTIGVYAGVSTDAYREDEPLPIPSGHLIPAHKKSAEILADAVTGSAGLDVVSVRIGAIWGPLGRPVSPFFALPGLVHAAVRGGAAQAGGTATPFGPATGAGALPGPVYAEDSLDICYVRDCGRAIALLQTAPELRHRTYNVGSGRTTTNREVADAIGRAVPGAGPALAQGRNPIAPDGYPHLDIGRLREDTGFVPEYDVDSGVADYVRWLRAGHPR